MKRIFTSMCIVFMLIFNGPTNSYAAGTLVDCDQSPAFTKRLNASVKKLEGRLSKYEPGSPPALALQQQIDRTKTRFKRYGESNLLCGTDGLPHLITDGDWKHASEFMTPGIMFLYIAGWIGWSGRTYIRSISTEKNPAQSEIIIDVPKALKIIFSGFAWPAQALAEYKSGDLLAAEEDVTVSPR